MTRHRRPTATLPFEWASGVRSIGAAAGCASALFLILLVSAPPATADDSLRCGSWIVARPVSLDELLSKCGEPQKKEVTTEDIRSSGRSGSSSRKIGTTTIEKWTYNADGQSLPMIVTIVDGQVTKIDRER